MPVFAARTGFLHYLFSDMRKLNMRRRMVIALLLFLGLLTPTLNFFSFESEESGHVAWTGLNVMSSMLDGVPERPLPQMHSGVETVRFGIWNPLYFLAFVTAYGSLGILGMAATFQPLRRLFRIAGPVGAFAASWCVGRSNPYPFTGFTFGIRSGLGPVMLAILLVLTWLVADTKVVPD